MRNNKCFEITYDNCTDNKCDISYTNNDTI